MENKKSHQPIQQAIFDTHCHANLIVKEKFDILLTKQELEKSKLLYDSSAISGVKYILNVGTSIVECINCIDLAKTNTYMFAGVGIHPCDITLDWKKDILEVKKMLTKRDQDKIICIGECGLDLYHRQDTIDMQLDLLRTQIELALELNMPISLHMRQATEQMHKILEEFKGSGLKGIMHCFPEKLDFANYIINYGLLIGIGGPITYPKNLELQETFTHIPLEKIVLETDAPFLPPQSKRGKQNLPDFLPEVAQKIAELKGISFDEVAKTTTDNALKLFGL